MQVGDHRAPGIETTRYAMTKRSAAKIAAGVLLVTSAMAGGAAPASAADTGWNGTRVAQTADTGWNGTKAKEKAKVGKERRAAKNDADTGWNGTRASTNADTGWNGT
jgi:hypothetical protein